jgi:hypothetical protein
LRKERLSSVSSFLNILMANLLLRRRSTASLTLVRRGLGVAALAQGEEDAVLAVEEGAGAQKLAL